MKTFLVKIDQNSVKENTHTYRQNYVENHSRTVTIKVDICNQEITDYLRNNFTALMVNMYKDSYFEHSEYRLINLDNYEPICDYLVSKGINRHDIQLEIHQNPHYITSMYPEPKYLFKYEDTEIECCNCNAKFSHDLLEDIYDYDYHRSNICPKCYQDDCCELEFEELKIT